MRLILSISLALVLLPIWVLPAQACDLPFPGLTGQAREDELTETLTCLIAESAALRSEQARMRDEIAALQDALGQLPGEYVNDNGKVSLPSGTIDRASFLLTTRQNRQAAALAIDPEVFAQLCAGPGGCSVSVFLETEGLRLSDAGEATSAGPCALSYSSASGAWSRGADCGGEGSASGVDGNAIVASEAPSGGAEIALVAGGGCILADSEAQRALGGDNDLLAPDVTPGFYLIAAPALRDGFGRFTCTLKIE